MTTQSSSNSICAPISTRSRCIVRMSRTRGMRRRRTSPSVSSAAASAGRAEFLLPLEGKIPTNGSKNSALPALAAALLTDGEVRLRRIPRVRDIRTMQRLLVDIGAQMEFEDDCVVIRTPQIVSPEAPYELVKTMRASSLVLGPLVARTGRARVSLPGGCAIGARPINLHIMGLESLGARIFQEHGYIEAQAPDGLKGAQVHFERITVTGTEDLLMAAVLARGETVIENAAREPEVTDLAALLGK